MARAARAVQLSELARALELRVDGSGDPQLAGFASLEGAGPGDLAFIRAGVPAERAARTRASAVIAPLDLDLGPTCPVLRSANPSADFARAIAWLGPEAIVWPADDPTISPSARIDPSARIGPGCAIAPGVRIGARTELKANVTVYPGAQIGADCVLHAGVVIREHTRIGDRVDLQPAVVLGGDGFGYVADASGHLVKRPHLGCVVVEDDVEIGAGSTVDRATLDETRIRRGAKIDNLVQIAHNCEVGEGAIIAAQVGLAGSTRVGAGAVLMGQAGVAGQLEIGAGAFVGAQTGVHKDVAARTKVFGTPQLEARRWHRAAAALVRLPELLKRVRALERSADGRKAAQASVSDRARDEEE